MEPDPRALRSEHDAMAARLASRASTGPLAWALSLGCLSALILAVSAKLWWDLSEYHPELYLSALGLGVAVALAALTRLTRGVRLARGEREEFVRLLELRRQLGIGDPRTMLPERGERHWPEASS
jgi:peptidoglycan/LPS O-acetylase OafA/YrhL